MLKTASKPVDVQDLHFKLQCRLKIFEKEDGQLTKTAKSLLASASRYGLVFVGSASSKLKVFRFETIEEICTTEADKNYVCREINLNSQPYHISVNCEHTILAVVVENDSCLFVSFYDVSSFYKEEIVVLNNMRLTSTPGLELLQANWHPTIGNIFTECKSDGTLGIYELKDGSFDVKKLPAESKASCFCWSPKGKQIAVGSQDGKIIHYKPDLKAVKSIDAPPFEKPHSLLSLQWISNYQFVGVFKMSNEVDPECSLVLIDAPKTGNPVFTNFYDICYSNGNIRPPQFYLISEQHWNILIVASANSMEVGVLSSTGDVWTQCILPDSARAELPLDENQDETFPVGMTVDTSSVKPVLWGESYLQPGPSLILLSHEGVLCSFKMVNLREGAPSVNSPPENVNDLSGLKYFTGPVVEVPPISTPQPEQSFQGAPLQERNADTTPVNSAPLSTPQRPNPATPQGQQTPTTPLSTVNPATPRQTKPNVLTNLFGGQITITPIQNKDGRPATSAASVGSMLLSQTTPEGGKGPSVPFLHRLAGSDSSETNKTAPVTASSFRMESLLSGNGQPRDSTPSFTGQGATGSIQQQTSYHPAASAATPQNVPIGSHKTTTKPSIPSSVNLTPTQAPVNPAKNVEESAELRKMAIQMIRVECAALDREIRDLILQGQHLRINLNPKEMDVIVQQTESIKEFLKELAETCEIQTSEIHTLKQTTIQSWAWLEEARSRFKDSQDEELKTLMKSKPLDSVSEKHLTTLKQMQYYLNSQLSQSHKALDDQWDKFQDYCRKTNRVQLPTMEAIFQTMVKQSAVLQKHNYILKDVKSQIKGKQNASNRAALFNPLERKDNLENSFRNLKLEPESIYHIYHQKVLNRVKSVPPSKTNQLRRILHSREVPHVMVKSQMSTSILNSTSRMNQNASNLLKTPPGKTQGAAQLPQCSPLDITSAPQIASTPLSAFASINSNPIGKQQSQPRFGNEVLVTPPSSNLNYNKDNLSATPTYTGQNQNLFKTSSASTVGTNTFGFNKTPSNTFAFSQIPNNQNMAVPSNSTTSIPKQYTSGATSSASNTATLQSTKPSAAFGQQNTPSNSLISQTSAPQLFSFAFSNPTAGTQSPAVSTTVSFKNTATITPSTDSSAPPTSTFSFAKPLSTTPAPFGTTGSVSTTSSGISKSTPFNFGGNSIFSKNNSGSSTQSTQPENLSMFGTPTNDRAVSIETPTQSTGTSSSQPTSESKKETVPKTTTSIFGTTTIPGVSSTKSSIFQTSTTNSGILPASSKSIFGSSSGSSVFGTTGTVSSSSLLTFGTTATSGSTATGSSSIFGTTSGGKSSSAVSSSSPIFGTSRTSESLVPSATKSIFGTAGIVSSSSQSLFGGNASTSESEKLSTAVSSTTPSIFGTASSVSAPTKSIFGATSVSAAPTSSSSQFGTPSSTSVPIFGTSVSSSGSAFGVSSTSGTSESSTSKSIFGTSAPSGGTTVSTPGATSPTSLFVTSTTKSIFGTTNTVVPSTSASIFGSAASSIGATKPSIFGATAVTGGMTPTTTKSIFGATVTTATSSVFGAPATTATSSVFGTPGTTATSSVFGAPATTATSSVFGAPATTATSSVFGAAVTTATSSVFGAPTTTATPSIFGAPAVVPAPVNTAVTSSQPGFGTTNSSSLFATSSSFGAGTPTTASSIFGSSTSTTSPFGKPAFGVSAASASSPFGATSPFGGATSSNSVFGQAAATASPFSTSTATAPFGSTAANAQSPFGAAPSTSDSVFGGTTPAVCSPFGSSQGFGSGFNAGTTVQPSPFGQANTFAPSPTAAPADAGFGQNSGSSGSIFGGFGTTSAKPAEASFGFGGLNVGTTPGSPFSKPSETKSPFGGTTFNATSSTGSLFGPATSSFGNNNGTSVFGQSSFGGGSAFSSTQGPFSGGGGSIAQTGFGVAQNVQKPAAFGGAPTFGGTPAFGAAPTFGGAPAFGSTSPFGGASKVFGAQTSSPTGSVFGSTPQQSTGFGGFGSPGFGNLAQQPNSPAGDIKQGSGFGTFASQNTIGFGSLAQQNTSGQAPFSGNSSFSSWR